MSVPKLYGLFLAQKVSKIRFVWEQYSVSKSFVTGSWWSSTNSINLWTLTKDEYSEEDNESDDVPVSVANIPVDGDVTGLEFLDYDNIAVSTSSRKSEYN